MAFQTTNWTLVLQAADSDTTPARGALEALCRAYRYPVYAFIRRQGYSDEDAQDLTQGYFTRFIEKKCVKDLNPELGRFRSFVLASVRHYLANERDRERALKRGGGRTFESLDHARAEERYALEPVDWATPDRLFERAWAGSVFDRVMDRLAQEAARTGGVERFAQLKAHLTEDDESSSYRDLAAAWGVGESAVRVSVHRLRRRFGKLLREEVATTVADPADIDAEIRHLLEMLGDRDRK